MGEHIRRVTLAAVVILSIVGCNRTRYSVTGRVMNARNGEPVASATVAAKSRDTLRTQTGDNGYYVLAGLARLDTLVVSAGGYVRTVVAVDYSAQNVQGMRRDVYLEPGVDTAFTAAGPVDADVFLENSGLKRKKLSLNEARLALVTEIPGARVRKGALVKVGDDEEWLFEMKIGRAMASVYLDAYTGRIRSIESDDPTMDRALQSHVGR